LAFFSSCTGQGLFTALLYKRAAGSRVSAVLPNYKQAVLPIQLHREYLIPFTALITKSDSSEDP